MNTPFRPRRVACLLLALVLPAIVPSARGAEKRPFREARFDKGELKYLGGLPVLVVEGTPPEIGRQKAVLTGDAVRAIIDYPKRMLRLLDREGDWPKCVQQARALAAQFPPDHRDELAAFAQHSGLDADAGLVANTITDMYRGGLGCSALIVEPGKSATKAPLFGRNLDFFSLGLLEKYGLVTVYRPKGKHAFVSVGFPGLLGCLSGMNDAGLALAVHEVYLAADGAPLFDPKGMPYTLCFRRILEQCTTIEEAEKLLRATPRTTLLSLSLADRRGGAVLEMTPKSVVLRRGADGLCICTNHFRGKGLSVFPLCGRYSKLAKAAALETVGIEDLAKKLDEVNQGRLTVQAMIFEPGPLVLHLGMGSCPATKEPLRRLPLAELLKTGTREK